MTINMKNGKTYFDFDMPQIIEAFFDKSAEDQELFIRAKLRELAILEDARLTFIDRLKRSYLLKREYIDLILCGLLYQAQQDLEDSE